MVYTSKDIAHLEVMAELDAAVPVPIDIKKVLALDSISLPTDLTSNIITLATKLRSEGFIAYADQLEEKLLAYKTADVHLYRVHDEDGEDLVDRAHPDGDVNMGDGEHGDVETIVSKQKKILDVVKKTPTGKLAEYVSACKIALGQDTNFPIPNQAYKNLSQSDLESFIRQRMQIVKQLMTDVIGKANKELTFDINEHPEYTIGWLFGLPSGMKSAVNIDVSNTMVEPLTASPTLDNLKKLDVFISGVSKRIVPSVGTGITEQTYAMLKGPIAKAQENVKEAIHMREQVIYLAQGEQEKILNKQDEAAPAPKKETAFTKSFEQVNSLKSKVNSWRSIRTISKNPDALKWIDNEVAALDDIIKRYEKVPEDQQAGMLTRMQKEINEEVADIDTFAPAKAQ